YGIFCGGIGRRGVARKTVQRCLELPIGDVLAIAVEAPTLARGVSCTKVNHHKLGNEDDNWYFEIWTYSFEIWRSKFI
ncbi:hypothetical protein Csa_023728, partial [Cucumis sativus]